MNTQRHIQMPDNRPNKRIYQCKFCNKSFAKPSALQPHIYTHTGERPYACHIPGCNRRFSVVSNLRRHFKVHGRKAAATAASNASTCLRPLACSPPISSLMQHQQQEKQSSSSSSSSASIVKSSPSLSVNNSFESWSLIDAQPLDTTHLQLQHSYTGVQTPISTSAPIPAVTSVLLDHEFMPSTPAFFNLPIMDHDPAAIGTSTTSPQTHSLYPVLDSWLSMPLLANLAQSSTTTLGWFE